MLNEGYSICQFSEGQGSDSKGITAGMWAIKETRTTIVAFTDTRWAAEALKAKLEMLDERK